ncbi:IscS subfamily cysteine desulfurase [Sporosarcina obsidiansis]|uniref:IscS subfamily cysteine desulfurase n=1 Tax=Sporosarcina obsidiansis TaxID=2660748 RepID=UPI0018918CB2|nr:IscS subfamily cysteine desulfurase [Sporosarcina obsidiansis]
MYYFDYAATTPLHPEAAKVYVSIAQQQFGNTTSLHDVGGIAHTVLRHCREQLATLLDVQSEGIYFTSGGTESNSLALISLAYAARQKGNHIILSAAEHPSLHSAAAYLTQQGFTITTISFTANGFIDLEELTLALTEQTIVVSIQHCNPEIGTIQPIRLVHDIVKAKGILLHSDCVQSFGKLNIREITPFVDSLSVSSHKIYGPKGVGALYIDPRLRTVPLFPGAVQEKGFRGGTVNVPGIAAFLTAAELTEKTADLEYFRGLRKTFFDSLNPNKMLFTFFGTDQETEQLPHIIGLRVNRSEGQLIMLELNRRGFAVSTGSACQVGQQQTSTTMGAMKIPDHESKGLVRISFGQSSNPHTVLGLANTLVEISKEQNGSKLAPSIL